MEPGEEGSEQQVIHFRGSGLAAQLLQQMGAQLLQILAIRLDRVG
jgi:hypothetical protein